MCAPIVRGRALRAVAATRSAPTASQNAKQFRRVHVQRVERAAARVGEHVDRALGRDLTEPPVIDLDATQVEVYGAFKQGAARSRLGAMSYAPHVAFWSQRGRALTPELVGGNREKLTGPECARIASRALRLLAQGHAPAIFRIDSAYYQLELLERLRKERSRFTVSVPRSQAMWRALAEIPEDAWADALEMPGAQVAERTYRPGGWKYEPLRLIVRRVPFTASEIAKRRGSRPLKTIHPEQLQLALDGKVALVYGYSFILTDIHWQPAVWIEHFHRHRAQIEERLKEAKLGQALRHPPSGDQHANRVWLTAALLALNLTALCCDLCPAAGASGKSQDPDRHRRPHAPFVAGSSQCRLQRGGVRIHAEGTLQARRDAAVAVDGEEPGLGPQVEGLQLGPQPLRWLVVRVDLLVDEGDPAAEASLKQDGDVGDRPADPGHAQLRRGEEQRHRLPPEQPGKRGAVHVLGGHPRGQQ